MDFMFNSVGLSQHKLDYAFVTDNLKLSVVGTMKFLLTRIIYPIWVDIQADKGFLCDIPFHGQPYTGKGKSLSASKRITGQSKSYRMPKAQGPDASCATRYLNRKTRNR